MRLGQRTRVGLLGTATVLVALIAIAFALGGSGTKSKQLSSTATFSREDAVGVGAAPVTVGHAPAFQSGARGLPVPAAPPPAVAEAPIAASAGGGGASAGSTTGASAGGAIKAADASVASGASLDATRIVKTGDLVIKVDKGSANVQKATQELAALATAEGGYVASSNTSLDSSSPYGEVVLRIPVARFGDAITKSEAFGKHTVSLTTSAEDVTGKYVDLNAKLHALQQTRSTYLSILSKANTIGATLAVQERIDEVQQQIDQLEGQIKLLGNQSSYSTLTVDVETAGVTPLAKTHHHRHGIGKAWHDSWARFGRGVDAIVGAIGPIVFALLLIAALGLIGLLGYRGVRRATGGTSAAV